MKEFESYLEQCLQSIVAQTYTDLEIILVDDGSTDGTAQLCDELALEDERIRVFHKENGGYGSTINNSIVLAQGKYFKQLDGDDWFDTENIEQFLNWLSAVDADFVGPAKPGNRDVEAQLARGVALKHMARHWLGLFAGQPGGRAFRQVLGEGAHRPGAGWPLVEQALALTQARRAAA